MQCCCAPDAVTVTLAKACAAVEVDGHYSVAPCSIPESKDEKQQQQQQQQQQNAPPHIPSGRPRVHDGALASRVSFSITIITTL